MMRLSLSLLLLVTAGVPAGEEPRHDLALAMNMYANQRARRVGDILVVVVDEQISSSSKDSVRTGKEAAASVTAPQIGDPTSVTLAGALAHLQAELSGSSSFTGEGTQSLNEAMAARFSVRVVDQLDNGLLVVQGERTLKLKDETVNVTLTGMLRPRDVTADNSVLSSQISDARIVYHRQGEISRGARPGWLWRSFQFINPF